MVVVPDAKPEGINLDEPTTHEQHVLDEKRASIEVASQTNDSDYGDGAKIYVPDDSDEFIDPRLKDYPVPLVAKTVDLHNDFRSVSFGITFLYLYSRCGQRTNPHLPLLGSVNILGRCWLWNLFILLLQALSTILDQLCCPIAFLGNGRCDGQVSTKAYLQHLRQEVQS